MAEKDLSGVKIAIVLTDDFEQVEMTEPRAGRRRRKDDYCFA